MTHDEQLVEWVKGNPIHGAMYENKESNLSDDGECCPDFSCCHSKLLWPEERRIQFAKANQEVRERMMLGGLPDLSDVASSETSKEESDE